MVPLAVPGKVLFLFLTVAGRVIPCRAAAGTISNFHFAEKGYIPILHRADDDGPVP